MHNRELPDRSGGIVSDELDGRKLQKQLFLPDLYVCIDSRFSPIFLLFINVWWITFVMTCGNKAFKEVILLPFNCNWTEEISQLDKYAPLMYIFHSQQIAGWKTDIPYAE